MKYTKGNWQVTKSGNTDFELAVVTDKDGGSVCHITNWSEAEANAKLIAAAPELLEALIRAKKVLDERLEVYNYMISIESVIKKATK